MNFIYICLILMQSITAQSFLNRIIVPVYVNSEFSYGYDDNYLKLSIPEQDSNLYYRLGDSKQVESSIFKNKINILYMPYIFNNHDTKFDFTIATSNYSSSKLKSYNRYSFKVSQHLAPYTWAKFRYSYTPSFYVKSYLQSDRYILYDISDHSDIKKDNYMPSLFTSEVLSFELSMPIPYVYKTYFSAKYLFETQYFNPDFIEFDLKISSYYLKIRKKIFNKLNTSIAYMKTNADNISFNKDGLLSTYDKDRSYFQDKMYFSFSIQKFYLLGQKMSLGLSSSYEQREFTSNIESDKLHFMRKHKDVNVAFWLKKHWNNSFDFRVKAIHRNRATLSPYDAGGTTVNAFKSFKKFEMWLSIIYKLELNVY